MWDGKMPNVKAQMTNEIPMTQCQKRVFSLDIWIWDFFWHWDFVI